MNKKAYSFMSVVFCTMMLFSGLVIACRCCADVTGGYMGSSPSELLYLRLTQAGTALDGDLNLVDANDTSQGFTATRYNVSGTIVQRHVELRIDGFLGIRSPLVDGDMKSGRLSLNFPQNNGQFMQDTLYPTSALAWNRNVTSFETKQVRLAYLRQEIGSYNSARDQYVAAKADLPTAEAAYQAAVRDEAKAKTALALAQSNASQAQQQYTKAKAEYDRLDATWDDKLEGDAYQQQEDNHVKAGQIEADAEDSMAPKQFGLIPIPG